MSDDTPDLPVPAERSSWLRLPKKLSFTAFLKSALKAVAAGRKLAGGDLQGAIDDALAAYEGIGDLELAQKKAAKLVGRALGEAIGELIHDHRHHLGPAREAPPSSDEVAVELTLDADFFERPEALPALAPLKVMLGAWLQRHGDQQEPNGIFHKPVRARTIADRLGPYYAAALAREYRRRPEDYQGIWDAIQAPVTRIEQRARDWRAYHARLVQAPDKPLFADTFSLRDVYQPLRAWWLERKAEVDDDDYDGRRGRRDEEIKHVVDVNATLHGWLDDPAAGDAIRVVSGGPGAGKSSLARMIAAERAKVTLGTPGKASGHTRAYRIIFVELHRFDLRADLSEAVGVYAREACGLHVNPLDHLDGDPLLLIFDGLDELAIREGAGRQSVVDLVRQVDHLMTRLNHDAPRVRALLLGREVVVSALEVYCRRRQRLLNLLPYRIPKDDQHAYLGDRALIGRDQRADWWQCYGSLVDEPLDGMPEELERGRIAELTAEPLLNYLIAITRAEGRVDFADAQTSLTDVYDDLVAQVYRRTHAKRPGDADDDRHALPAARAVSLPEFRRFLQTIALAAWHGNGRIAHQSQIQALLGRRLRSKVEALTAGATDGISRLVAAFYFRPHRGDHGDPAFEFTHQSFAEYLLAQHIIRFLDRLRSKHAQWKDEAEDDDESGWSPRRCLREWAVLFAHAPIEQHVFDFVHDGLRRRAREDAASIGAFQDISGGMISRVLVDDFPTDALPATTNVADVLRGSRCAGSALLVVASACARITERQTPIRHPHRRAFGDWLDRLQAVGEEDNGADIRRHLVWLPLGRQILRGADLQGAHLQGIDLQGADLRRVDLQGADLLNGASLEGANLDRAHLYGTNCDGANLRGVNLQAAEIAESTFQGANLEGADLEWADLQEVDLRKANLQGVDVRGAALRWVHVQEADLRGADLEGVDLQQEVKLAGARYDADTRLPTGIVPEALGMIFWDRTDRD